MEELLRLILEELKRDKPALGLLDDVPLQSTRIYCNRAKCQGALWYTRRDDQNIPVTAKCIRGYLTRLEYEKVERYGKEKWVTRLFVLGDRPYELEFATESNFSKCILLAIASMPVEDLQEPVTIAVDAGDSESVLLARVYSASGYVKNPGGWDSINWKAIAQQAKNAIASKRDGSPSQCQEEAKTETVVAQPAEPHESVFTNFSAATNLVVAQVIQQERAALSGEAKVNEYAKDMQDRIDRRLLPSTFRDRVNAVQEEAIAKIRQSQVLDVEAQ